MLVIGRMWGSSVFSACLASLLSASLTAERFHEPVKGLSAYVMEQAEVSCQPEEGWS